jgi:hypothetical protein
MAQFYEGLSVPLSHLVDIKLSPKAKSVFAGI